MGEQGQLETFLEQKVIELRAALDTIARMKEQWEELYKDCQRFQKENDTLTKTIEGLRAQAELDKGKIRFLEADLQQRQLHGGCDAT
jgi:chromosome segregation ATPase